VRERRGICSFDDVVTTNLEHGAEEEPRVFVVVRD
jgi:hypothetical protein